MAATVKSVDAFNGIFSYPDWFRPFIPVFDELTGISRKELEDFQVGEEISCFYEALDLLDSDLNLIGLFENHPQSLMYLQTRADLLNRFFQLIRERMKSEKVKLAIQKRTQKSATQLKGCRKLIDACFERWSKLLVLRIDFGFKIPDEIVKANYHVDDLKHEFHSLDKLVLLKELLRQFLNNRRHNSILSKIKAYIFKFEHGIKKGFHAHAILILSGNECQKDGYYAHEITEYWKKLTHGNGCTYNCHMAKQKYKRLGIGMINYLDSEKRMVLDECLQYLCKADQAFIFRTLDSSEYRSLQKSQKPKKISNAGRPRKTTQDDKSSVNKKSGGK
ncbi:inovirus-type Gp2 protein [Acinetobacter venetianus]|uniref:inovirus-type Gp2 protein n=1 Tax=Acinetobacter venetianus TaxID=52133 RepID=UPI001F1C72BE|nr:inovirus-type Gp2 protein [Acinetobacter venetianus]